jgi:hypothetical protein
MAATAKQMTLAHARARAARKKQAAFTRYHTAGTDAERDTAERDWNAAQAELDTLPGLVSPEAIANQRGPAPARTAPRHPQGTTDDLCRQHPV